MLINMKVEVLTVLFCSVSTMLSNVTKSPPVPELAVATVDLTTELDVSTVVLIDQTTFEGEGGRGGEGRGGEGRGGEEEGEGGRGRRVIVNPSFSVSILLNSEGLSAFRDCKTIMGLGYTKMTMYTCAVHWCTA